MNFKIMLRNSQKHTRKLVTNKETNGRETYEFIREGADIFKPLDFFQKKYNVSVPVSVIYGGLFH